MQDLPQLATLRSLNENSGQTRHDVTPSRQPLSSPLRHVPTAEPGEKERMNLKQQFEGEATSPREADQLPPPKQQSVPAPIKPVVEKEKPAPSPLSNIEKEGQEGEEPSEEEVRV